MMCELPILSEDALLLARDLIKVNEGRSNAHDPCVYSWKDAGVRLGLTDERTAAATDILVDQGLVAVGRGIFLFTKPALIKALGYPSS
jgi:hypothetical protein